MGVETIEMTATVRFEACAGFRASDADELVCSCGWLEEDHVELVGELAAARVARQRRRPRPSSCPSAARPEAEVESASTSASGSTTETRSTRTCTGNPAVRAWTGGSNAMRTSLADDAFTNHEPRHPWAPHPHTRPWSGATERTWARGVSELEHPAHAHPDLGIVDFDPAVLGHHAEQAQGTVHAREEHREARRNCHRGDLRCACRRRRSEDVTDHGRAAAPPPRGRRRASRRRRRRRESTRAPRPRLSAARGVASTSWSSLTRAFQSGRTSSSFTTSRPRAASTDDRARDPVLRARHGRAGTACRPRRPRPPAFGAPIGRDGLEADAVVHACRDRGTASDRELVVVDVDGSQLPS